MSPVGQGQYAVNGLRNARSGSSVEAAKAHVVGGLAPNGNGGNGAAKEHRVLYCIVPADLAPKLHDYLRRHWRDERGISVVVEQRGPERRSASRRTRSVSALAEDRRTILNAEGRRAADRRATALPVDAPPLPRRARAYADRLTFIERFEPDSQTVADAATNRLIIRLQGGDRTAMSELYLCYFDSVYGYARIALRDAHEAEDTTQQVFMNVLQALPRYEIRHTVPFRAWLFRIARNVVIDVLRKRARFEPRDPDRLGEPRDRAASAELDSILSWLTDVDLSLFIERLPAAQREVLVLRYMLELRSEEIANIVGRTPKAVRNLQGRALKTLEERLVAIGRGPLATRRAPMLTRLKPIPVMTARRFALAKSTPHDGLRRRAV